MIYVKESLQCSLRDDLQTEGIEALWVEIKQEAQKAFYLSYIYRPPSAQQKWMNDFESVLQQVYTEDKEVNLLGDLNFNLLENNNNIRNWLQITESINLSQVVDTPTRVTETSSTLIDHAYCSKPENIADIFVPCYSISDHYPVCLTQKSSNKTESDNKHKTITFRNMRHFDSNCFKFLEDLNTQPWQLLSFFENPNDALDFLMQLFESLLDKHVPKITKRVKRTLQSNWFNTEISEASKMRDYYHRIHDMQNYRIWRNKTKTLISNSKQQYFTKNINENKSNPKQLWKNLHEITNKSKKQHAPTIVSQEGEPVLGPEETANSFNDLFTSVFLQYSSACNIQADCISKKLKDFIKTNLPQEARFQTSQIIKHLSKSNCNLLT